MNKNTQQSLFIAYRNVKRKRREALHLHEVDGYNVTCQLETAGDSDCTAAKDVCSCTGHSKHG